MDAEQIAKGLTENELKVLAVLLHLGIEKKPVKIISLIKNRKGMNRRKK